MDNHDSNDRKTSSKDQSCSDPDGSVGYRRPPKRTRFRPGTSGNRKGRPPGSKNRKTVVAKVAEEMHWVVENGERKRRSALGLVVRLIRNKALEGDSKAFRAAHELQVKFAPQESSGNAGWLVVSATITPEEWIAEVNKRRKPRPEYEE